MRTTKPKKITMQRAYAEGFYDGRDDKPSRAALCGGLRIEKLYLRGVEAGRARKEQNVKPS